VIHDSINAQQQAVSGVSLDEEAVNMTAYQRAYQSSAQYISVVDQMLQAVIAMVTT
jgi:flagellar hook-associated protein 1 FlgK